MNSLRLKAVLPLLLAVGSSACQADEAGANGPGEQQTPAYGELMPLKGHYVWGFESADFYPCEATRVECVAIPAKDRQACWVRFTEDARARLSEVEPGNSHAEGGELWIEGAGRKATEPGQFGHLGAYSCQIEITRIDKADPAPPYLFEFRN